MTSNIHDSFLQLVRLGIGHTRTTDITEVSDWLAMKALAEKQGLSAVVVDGIEKLPKELMPPKLMLLQWIGEVHQLYEERFSEYKKAIGELAGFYSRHGFKMMVLKGYACSLDWPKPEHRPCGDIDTWLFGEQKAADAALTREKGIRIDNSHHHHTVFDWQGFMVENHYDFIDVYHRRSGPRLEIIFKNLGLDDSCKVELHGETVYLPSVNLHALFLLYHTMLHFTSTEMSIRQILDWGLFVKAHTEEIDWKWFLEKANEFHLSNFLNIINAICVEDLGFETSIFHGVMFNSVLKSRVLDDTLSPEFTEEEPKTLVRRFFFRCRRWKSHEWKHKLCYRESMFSIFWSAVWGHMLKPSNI